MVGVAVKGVLGLEGLQGSLAWDCTSGGVWFCL